MKNILSSRTGSYETLQKLGIKGVEIGPPKPENVDKLKAELSKYDLKALSISGGIDVTDDKGIDDFDTLLNGAVNMGSKIIFVSAKASDKIPREVTFERLRKIGDKAAGHDVTIAIETHPILCHNGDVALQTMEGVNHPNIRLNFDTANIYYYNENIDTVEELKKVAKYVASVHLKDTDGKPKSFNFPPLGEGIVDFPEVFRILNELDFYGPFTFELESTSKDEMAAALEKSVNYLKETGCI
ncbi:TIM barrel protein [Candidatus Poribacteria bacterium]|nr:TIM barrel protein [Candidatus Poribacteria bacterium]